MTSGVKNVYKRYSDAGPGPEVQAFWHFMAFFDILWYFGTFAKKSNKKSNPIFPIFRLFPTFRLSDSTALMLTPTKRDTALVGVDTYQRRYCFGRC